MKRWLKKKGSPRFVAIAVASRSDDDDDIVYGLTADGEVYHLTTVVNRHTNDQGAPRDEHLEGWLRLDGVLERTP